MDISIVVPVKNEEANIEPLVAEIRSAMQGLEYEIIYVDDGSDDSSRSVLQRLMSTTPELKTVRHRHSCGQSTAVVTGVLQARAPLIATLDGDGQNDPADIPRLLEIWRREEGKGGGAVACIAGWRADRKDDALKRMSSKVANAVRSRLLRDSTPDTGCGLKLFSRDTFLRLPYFDHMHRFLPALFMRAGFRVISEPVNHRPRERGVSKYGFHNRLWVGLVDIVGVIWLLNRARNPEIVKE
jgi:dolichol-phosphate mannosyltransferase